MVRIQLKKLKKKLNLNPFKIQFEYKPTLESKRTAIDDSNRFSEGKRSCFLEQNKSNKESSLKLSNNSLKRKISESWPSKAALQR